MTRTDFLDVSTENPRWSDSEFEAVILGRVAATGYHHTPSMFQIGSTLDEAALPAA